MASDPNKFLPKRSLDVKDSAEVKSQNDLSAQAALQNIMAGAAHLLPEFQKLNNAGKQQAAAMLANMIGLSGASSHWGSMAQQQTNRNASQVATESKRSREHAAQQSHQNSNDAAQQSHRNLQDFNTQSFNANHHARSRSAGSNPAGNPLSLDADSYAFTNPLTDFFKTAVGGLGNLFGGMGNSSSSGSQNSGGATQGLMGAFEGVKKAFEAGGNSALPGMDQMGQKMAGVAGTIDQVGKSILSFFKVLTGGDRIEIQPDGTEKITTQPLFPFIQLAVELGQKILTAFGFAALGAEQISDYFKSPGSELSNRQKRVDKGGTYCDIAKKLPEDVQKELFAAWDEDTSPGHIDSWRHLRSTLEEQALINPRLVPQLLPFVKSDEQEALRLLQAQINPPKPKPEVDGMGMLLAATKPAPAPEVKGLAELKELEEAYRNTVEAVNKLRLSGSSLEFQRECYEFRKNMYNCVMDNSVPPQTRLENLNALKATFEGALKADTEDKRAMKEEELAKEQKLREEAEQKLEEERRKGGALAARLANLEQQFASAVNQFSQGGFGPANAYSGNAGNAYSQGFMPGKQASDRDLKKKMESDMRKQKQKPSAGNNAEDDESDSDHDAGNAAKSSNSPKSGNANSAASTPKRKAKLSDLML